MSVVPVLLKMMPLMLCAPLSWTVILPLLVDWLKNAVSVERGTFPKFPPVVALSDQSAPLDQTSVDVVSQYKVEASAAIQQMKEIRRKDKRRKILLRSSK